MVCSYVTLRRKPYQRIYDWTRVNFSNASLHKNPGQKTSIQLRRKKTTKYRSYEK